ncbi:hypothetical protein RJ639_038170 [Escallonia herrerae]|uniref:Uncharacterized protein n=1 Tax=Escallonia herrerae TaxID=1293975 RepID=A0AA89BAI0_9ASTE|nr:hypothetical protein RJ639_038170 [Escallonia herrerae]
MRWEKIQTQARHGGQGFCGGPGKRWGHTCNAIGGGKLLYVFGGYGKDNCQTNQVHVFNTATRTWSEPVMRGALPTPRDSHSCTTVGDKLGRGPEAREGHSAALIGKRLFIFGGCGKSSNSSDEEYFDDVYILNTETWVWKRAGTSGTPPAKRDSHTCSSWRNKIIVIGGEDKHDYYLSDVHILDTDTLFWAKLNVSGQLLPPRAGHTTVAFGKNLFVFGGFTDEQNLYDDIYMLDVDTGFWIKVMATGEGPSARFSMAGESLDPQQRGLARETERDERRLEKLSLRKQLKLKCQEQHPLSPVHDEAMVRVDANVGFYQPMHMPLHMQPSRHNVYSNEYHNPLGKRTFEANVSKSLPDGYTIETVLDGRPLRGVLFTNKPSFKKADDDHIRRKAAEEIGGAKPDDDHDSKSEAARSVERVVSDDRQANGADGEESTLCEPQIQAAPPSDTKDPVASDATQSHEVPPDTVLSVAPILNLEEKETSDAPYSSTGAAEDTSVSANNCNQAEDRSKVALDVSLRQTNIKIGFDCKDWIFSSESSTWESNLRRK